MSNIYLNRSYREKLTFSILQFSKFEKIVSMSVFGKLQQAQISLNFKTCGNLKIRGLGKITVWNFFLFVSISNRIVPRFFMWKDGMIEKESLNFLKWFYSHLWLLTTRVQLFHFEKILPTESEVRQSSKWENF